jgi:hypothetical protein
MRKRPAEQDGPDVLDLLPTEGFDSHDPPLPQLVQDTGLNNCPRLEAAQDSKPPPSAEPQPGATAAPLLLDRAHEPIDLALHAALSWQLFERLGAPRYWLAPMVGSSEPAFRMMVRCAAFAHHLPACCLNPS